MKIAAYVTRSDLIERLAREATSLCATPYAFSMVFDDGYVQASAGMMVISPAWLRHYTTLVAEEAARECERVAWSNKATPMLGPEQNAVACAAAIRAKFGEPS